MRGLLYSASALDQAERVLPKLSFPEHLELAELARREGLAGRWRGAPLAQRTGELIAVARGGLKALGGDDAALLDPLEQVAQSGRSPAEQVLELHRTAPNPEALLGGLRLS